MNETLTRPSTVSAGGPTPTAVTLAERLPREVDGSEVVGGLVQGRAAGLNEHVGAATSVDPICLSSPAGRDIFRRSACLAFLEAARRAGLTNVRMRASLSTGVVASVSTDAPADWAAPIERELVALIDRDEPLRLEVWPTDEAITLFASGGFQEAVALLEHEVLPNVTLVRCAETVALGTGALLPSTRHLVGLTVVPHPDGLLLDLGDRIRREFPRPKFSTLVLERRAPRYGAEMTQGERAWLTKLGITSVGTYNRACVAGRIRQLIHVSEGYHEKRIAGIADTIRATPSLRIVSVAGPTSSGKTTFIKRLKIQLEIDGIRPLELSLDNYFVDRDRTPRDASGQYDFETLDALDLLLLDQHLDGLLRGKAVRTSRFDFHQGTSDPSGGDELCLGPSDVLLVEGLHALNARILSVAAPTEVFRIFVHPAMTLPFDHLSILEPIDVRLLRRLVRDRHQRGHSVAESIARWRSVRRAERVHVFPHQAVADCVFDTSLIYEPSVLKVFAERDLMEVPRGHPEAAAAHRLRRLLQPFVPIDPSEVPATSILREFIGKGDFSY